MQPSKDKNYLHLRFVSQYWRISEAKTPNFSPLKENQIILLVVKNLSWEKNKISQ